DKRDSNKPSIPVEVQERPAREKPGSVSSPPVSPAPTPGSSADRPRKIIGRFVESSKSNGQAVAEKEAPPAAPTPSRGPTPLVVFCHEAPDSFIGSHVAGIVRGLALRGSPVHLFSRYKFVFGEPQVTNHVVGATDEGDIVDQVQEFTRRAGNAFLQQFPASQSVALIGYEWTSAPVLSLLRGLRNLQGVLGLHTVERQRSDLSSELAQKIAEIEREGIEKARTLLLHDPGTAEVVRHWIPEAADRS